MRTRLAIALVGLSLFAAACGGSNKVGDKSLLNVRDQLPQSQLGARTTTTLAVTTTAQPASLGLKPATTKPATATTVAREQLILIYGDQNTTGQFSPNSATVFTNYAVRFQNNDTVARTVVFTGSDTRRSPAINPGASWTTTFTTPGTYNYQDRTRPYAVGSITVVAR